MAAIDSKYHIKIGDIGFLLAKQPRVERHIYSREESPHFVNKFSSGDPNYRDSTFFPHWVQLNWLNGFNQEFFDDGGKFYRSTAVDPTDQTKLTIQKAFNSAGQVVSGADIRAAVALIQTGSAASWANSNYLYRKQITITAPASQTLPVGYPIKVTEDTAALESGGKVQADRDDWRVFSFNGSSWTDLFRDYIGTTETWFATQEQITGGAANTNHYIYYGYSGETTNKQPSAVADWNSVYGAPANDTNTKGLWHVKETAGTTLADTSGNSHDGTIDGATFATGKFGKGLSFDGVNDFVSIVNHADLRPSGSFEISAYIKTSSTASQGIFTSWFQSGATYQGIRFRIENGNIIFDLGYTTSISSLVSAATYNNNVLRHVACTFDGTTQKIYVDGVLTDSRTAAGTQTYNASNTVRIGCDVADGPANSRFFSGIIDGVRIINGTATSSFPHALVTSDPTVTQGTEAGVASANSSAYKILAGASNGKIYEWDGATTWTERFDARRSTWYETGNDTNAVVGDEGGTEKAKSQGFQLSGALTVKTIEVYLKKLTGTPGDITVRIETDNAGVPSGTLANANATATITGFSSTSFDWKVVDFTNSFTLAAATTYHLVLKTAAAANDNNYAWASDASSPTYTLGAQSASTDGGSTWSAVSGTDNYFRVLGITTEVNCAVIHTVSGTQYAYFGCGPLDGLTDANAIIFRTTDGTTYTIAAAITGDATAGVSALGTYNSNLYAGVFPKAKVYKSTDGTTFALSKDIDEPNNPGWIWDFAVYAQKLYAAGGHPQQFRTSNSAGFLWSWDDFEWKFVGNFDFTVVKSLKVYDNLLFIGTISKRLYVFNTASIDKLLEFPWEVSIEDMETWQDKLAIALGPTDRNNPTGKEAVYLFDRNGFHEAFDTSNATRFVSLLSINNILMVGTGASGYMYRTVDGQYQLTGNVQSSYFEAQLPNIYKIWRSVTILYDSLPTGCSILVEYKTDETDASWTTLGTASTPLSTSATFNFGVAVYSYKLSLRITLTTTSVSLTPTLRKTIAKYVLSPDFKYLWKMKLLCVDKVVWIDGTEPQAILGANVSAGATSITLKSTDVTTPTSGFPDPNGSVMYAVIESSDGTKDTFSYTGKTSTTLTGIPATGTYALGAHTAPKTVRITGADLHRKILDLKQARTLYTFTDIDGLTYTILFHAYQADNWVVNQDDYYGGLENEVPITLLEA